MGWLWLLLVSVHVLSPTSAGGVTRVYYLGIRELAWNYAPTGRNVLANKSIAHNTYVQFYENRAWVCLKTVILGVTFCKRSGASEQARGTVWWMSGLYELNG